MIDQVAQVHPGTEPYEEQRREEALTDREQLRRHAARFPHRGYREAECESGQHHRHVHRGRDRRQQKQRHQADPQLQRELALLGDGLKA